MHIVLTRHVLSVSCTDEQFKFCYLILIDVAIFGGFPENFRLHAGNGVSVDDIAVETSCWLRTRLCVPAIANVLGWDRACKIQL